MSVLTPFSINLKNAREQKGWTQQQVANKTGIPRSRVGSYEEARATPCPATLAKLFRAFGITDISFADKILIL